MKKNKKIKILYNDTHQNMSYSHGPATFSRYFNNFFSKQKDFILMPIIFSHGNLGEESKINILNSRTKKYIEIIYDKQKISENYQKEISKKEFLSLLSPTIKLLSDYIQKEKPDIVFLNGFNLANWILLYSAYKNNIPVIVQHAGIWKQEILASKYFFSKSIMNIFFSMERDLIRFSNHHIFLNDFSRREFEKNYKSKETIEKIKTQSSIISLPISINKNHFFKLNNSNHKGTANNIINIGSVARWDNIKNHEAILGLALSPLKPKNWQINVVTKIPENNKNFDFKEKYKKHINIISPMKNSDLKNKFYKKMDLIFLPSRFDVSPTVVAESFCAGVPVLISEKVGWYDLYGQFGLHCHTFKLNSSDSKKIDIIERILLNKEKKIKSYTKFFNYLKKKHIPQKVFPQYLKLFKKYSK
ncbi:MAG TPA: glycosyltransferase [Candidatus Paceibacterota bacterium]|nr:glycosyltransferase [Candidatus Paceibacterota bacterium]HMP19142.1 glycosyltransferase [Candidatus Paceibacterota bacterium]HMP85149.1 glycosyltransferase [Candidatus Paceibacterota bacterium]